MICVDSNIWIYYFNELAPEHEKTISHVRNWIRTENILSSSVIILEIAHYFRFLPKNEFERIFDRMLRLPNLKLIDLSRPVLLRSLTLLAEHAHTGIGARDAVILATMELEKANKIATHDQVFRKIKHLKVIDPIDAA